MKFKLPIVQTNNLLKITTNILGYFFFPIEFNNSHLNNNYK